MLSTWQISQLHHISSPNSQDVPLRQLRRKMNMLLSIFSILVYVNTRRTWLALKMELQFAYRISDSRLIFGSILKHESKWKSLVGSFSWFTCFKSSSPLSLLYGIKINGFMPSRWPCNCSELNFAKIIL